MKQPAPKSGLEGGSWQGAIIEVNLSYSYIPQTFFMWTGSRG